MFNIVYHITVYEEEQALGVLHKKRNYMKTRLIRFLVLSILPVPLRMAS